jgi:hypothetical protein
MEKLPLNPLQKTCRFRHEIDKVRSGAAPAATLRNVGAPQPPDGPGVPTGPVSGPPQAGAPAGWPPGGMAGPGPISGAPFPGPPGPFMPPPFQQPTVPPPRPTRRTISRNKLLLIILIVGGVLVVAGGGVGFLLYNRATEIDRSTPTIAVRQFLGAIFLDQDDDRVRLFTCPSWTSSRTAEVRGRVDPAVRLSWDTITEQSRADGQAQVTAKLSLRYPGELAPSGEQLWRFDVVEENGWRVCGAGPA